MRNRTSRRRPYCLRCYAPLKGELRKGARTICPRCGFVNLKVDRAVFWTKERRLLELESLAKGVIVVFMVVIGLLMLWGAGNKMSFGLGQGWAVGFPILFGVLLWETASKITRWKPYLRVGLVWSILAAAPGIGLLLVAMLPELSPLARAVLAATSLPWFGVAFGIWRLEAACARWRARRILAQGPS